MFEDLVRLLNPFKASEGESSPLDIEHLSRLVARLGDPTEIERLLRSGQKINAIKVFRAQSGVGLREAKAAVEYMQSGVGLREAAVEYMQGEQPMEIQDQEAELVDLILRGEKIHAIKLYRERMGVGLKEAKAAVEQLQIELSTQRSVQILDVDPEVISLIQQGKQIHAIKLYRERTGVGLKEAKAVIDQLALTMQSKEAIDSLSAQPRVGLVDPEELQRLLRAGQTIQAIKYYRECTGLGLKESKDAIDWLIVQNKSE